jgi:hypothetical protein
MGGEADNGDAEKEEEDGAGGGEDDEDEGFCCRPSSGGLMFACSYSVCTILLGFCILMLQSVAEYQRQIGQIVDATCTLFSEAYEDGEEGCMGVLAAQFPSASCWVGMNVTRFGSTLDLPKKVRLVFRVDDGSSCAGLKMRRLRGAEEADEDEDSSAWLRERPVDRFSAPPLHGHGRSLNTRCSFLVSQVVGGEFDCSYMPASEGMDKGKLAGDRVMAMRSDELNGDFAKFLALGIILLILIVFCFIALLCHYISKTMA